MLTRGVGGIHNDNKTLNKCPETGFVRQELEKVYEEIKEREERVRLAEMQVQASRDEVQQQLTRQEAEIAALLLERERRLQAHVRPP